MNHTAGADIPAAIGHFHAAGWTVAAIADDLRVHTSTVYRWRAGTRRPNRANFTALRDLINARAGQLIHRRKLTPASVHLQDAIDALYTDADRAEVEELAARLRQVHAPRQVSVTALVDPFELAASGQPRQEAMWS